MNAEALSGFPEESFPCPVELQAEYRDLVARGQVRMRESAGVVCGLARDIVDVVARTIARIERLGEMFRQYRVILYENDSQDATLECLRAWQQVNSSVTILTEQLGNPRWGSVPELARAQQMAYYRNQYLRYALDHCGEFDYLVVVDTDLPGGWSYEGIADSFGHDAWDMIGSYGIQYMPYAGNRCYPVLNDAWAFREMGREEAHLYRTVNPRVFRRGQPLVPVWSCFGGLAIYRMAALHHGCEYGGGDCEHVPLHRSMRQRGFGRLFMNPSQIALYSTPGTEALVTTGV